MLNRTNKRKADRHQSSTYSQPDPVLYIQAHEADITCGPQAHALALSLEAQHAASTEGGNKTRLIQLKQSTGESEATTNAVWVDRYDVRLLLDTLPPPSGGSIDASADESARLSPTGWSDLPSDTEDMFFFAPDEVEDYHREKRRRMIEQNREERLRALRAEEGEESESDSDKWGGSDEEPDDAQKELMRRTAGHIMSSPNPAQLEMRILANHGADKRFAFLRGRWSRAWRTTKGRIRLESEAEKQKKVETKQTIVSMGGLAGYGDSDASDEEPTDKEEHRVNKTAEENALESAPSSSEEAIKESRRAKAKEWAEKRRAAKDANT